MRNIIRLNDATSHGGKVESVGASHFMVDGLGAACVGDPCSCPILGHDNCIIAEGDPHHTIDGVAVAYDGHKTSCGALLQASASSFSLA